MKKPILLSLLGLTACAGNSSKFSKLKTGMHTKQVVELVGEPESKNPIFTGEWWMYTKQNKMIVINNDTVVTVKQDLKASQDSMKNMLDTLGK
jgi:outer membrane protein assembly factor BamE (lipoprotein component of BamABCDE complex)